jgi:hypothetical protein
LAATEAEDFGEGRTDSTALDWGFLTVNRSLISLSMASSIFLPLIAAADAIRRVWVSAQ